MLVGAVAVDNSNVRRRTGLAPNEVHIDRSIAETDNYDFGRQRCHGKARAETGPA